LSSCQEEFGCRACVRTFQSEEFYQALFSLAERSRIDSKSRGLSGLLSTSNEVPRADAMASDFQPDPETSFASCYGPDRPRQHSVIVLLALGINGEVCKCAMNLVLKGQGPLIESQYPKGQKFKCSVVKHPSARNQCLGKLLWCQRPLGDREDVE
jgi:hypothetical protein